jgi:hypothetical protein
MHTKSILHIIFMNKTSRTINRKTGKGKNARYLYGSVNRLELLNSTSRGTIKLYNYTRTEYAEVDVAALRKLAKANKIRARFSTNGVGVYCVQDMPSEIYTINKVAKSTSKSRK